MKQLSVALLCIILIISLFLGTYAPVHEGLILKDRLTTLGCIINTSSISSAIKYDMMKSMGITDPDYANILNKYTTPSDDQKATMVTAMQTKLQTDGVI